MRVVFSPTAIRGDLVKLSCSSDLSYVFNYATVQINCTGAAPVFPARDTQHTLDTAAVLMARSRSHPLIAHLGLLDTIGSANHDVRTH